MPQVISSPFRISGFPAAPGAVKYLRVAADGSLSWEDAGVSDHGALGGLGDDDHTQYLLVDGTRAMTGRLTLPTGSRLAVSVGNSQYNGVWFNGDQIGLASNSVDCFTARSSGNLLQASTSVVAGKDLSVLGGEVSIVEDTAANVPLTVKGAASQSGNLTEWQDSTGAVVAQVSPSGAFQGPGATAAYMLGPAPGADSTGLRIDSTAVLALRLNNAPMVEANSNQNVVLRPYKIDATAAKILSKSGTAHTGDWLQVGDLPVLTVGNTGLVTVAGIPDATGTVALLVRDANASPRTIFQVKRAAAGTQAEVHAGDASMSGALWLSGNRALYDNGSGTVCDRAGVTIWGAYSTHMQSFKPLRVGSYAAPTADLHVISALGTRPTVAVQAIAAQTANLTEWQDSAGTVLAKISAAGKLLVPNGTGAAVSVGNSGGSGNYGFNIGSGGHVELVANGAVKVDVSATGVGFLGATPVAQQAHIADPAGGGTVDAEARTAINSILSALETYGLLATS